MPPSPGDSHPHWAPQGSARPARGGALPGCGSGLPPTAIHSLLSLYVVSSLGGKKEVKVLYTVIFEQKSWFIFRKRKQILDILSDVALSHQHRESKRQTRKHEAGGAALQPAHGTEASARSGSAGSREPALLPGRGAVSAASLSCLEGALHLRTRSLTALVWPGLALLQQPGRDAHSQLLDLPGEAHLGGRPAPRMLTLH